MSRRAASRAVDDGRHASRRDRWPPGVHDARRPRTPPRARRRVHPRVRRRARYRADGPPRRGPRNPAFFILAAVAVTLLLLNITLGPVAPTLVARWATDDRSARILAYWVVAWTALVPWALEVSFGKRYREQPLGWHGVVTLVCVVYAALNVGGRRPSHEGLIARAGHYLPDHLAPEGVADALQIGGLIGLAGLLLGPIVAMEVWRSPRRAVLGLWILGFPLFPVAAFAVFV